MRIVLLALVAGVLAAGCSGGETSDGSSLPPVIDKTKDRPNK